MTTENKKIEKKVEQAVKYEKTAIISKDKLLESGSYFGHKSHAWNPKMKEYLVPNKKVKGAHIIDVYKTQSHLEYAYKLVNNLASKGTQFIFVGTKKQAREAVKAAAERTHSLYVTERWLGGTLTNNETIMRRVSAMEALEAKAENNFKGYTKKESLIFEKELEKLHKNLNGIRQMKRIPQVMIVADPNEDEIAVKEAKRKGLKVISILDSNSNPDAVDLGVPGNDDSAKFIHVFMTIIADAIVKVKGGEQIYAYQEDSKIVLPEFFSKSTINTSENNEQTIVNQTEKLVKKAEKPVESKQ
ncbi:30S ribosomal protein S2 [Mycoplasmopsis cynos]|uniref:Small ribosomal subunit protein uS2 n=3 Tax=Mycoplasmopsis cynos TaxID=171284 RepID=A0ABD8AJT0_9BACT|nr:30S ribosomal protein S2 [Mycoplasmopsis cynos]WQQ14911.1 30S ribosomal protein S2 [Mycoplasmopsis cynos]WQQ15576.1 30S ribosomal protein S2 [Mycoplasmopsis cynos]WQQ15900.1 30S ribosomal protein S2 [Mycoplasmopsis cynos]WQQ18051.1 30S ribosomal protein S2 [Mycoplasmopsis cynos]WQQ19030.1 30S ribosomal protein S2 [Mycoplasmopsis cynos]